MKYWAATGLGNLEKQSNEMLKQLNKALKDSSSTVRVVSALALCKLDRENQGLPILIKELENNNLLVRLYAILGLEEIGEKALSAREAIESKTTGEYEYVRRVAKRLTKYFATIDKEK